MRAIKVDQTILNNISDRSSKGVKQLAILIDPDNASEEHLKQLCTKAEAIGAHYFFVGGSLLTDGDLETSICHLKNHTQLPVIIFPGSSSQLSSSADGLLFLSLLSSRNPEMLIGQQVVAAPYLRKLNIEILSTAYLLIDSGVQTTASYMSNSTPIPSDKSEIAACTALAGQYMGMKLVYLDGGSGAQYPVPANMIKKVKEYIDIPIIIGGGINSLEKAKNAFEAGADIIVIGNAFEEGESFSIDLGAYLKQVNA